MLVITEVFVGTPLALLRSAKYLRKLCGTVWNEDESENVVEDEDAYKKEDKDVADDKLNYWCYYLHITDIFFVCLTVTEKVVPVKGDTYQFHSLIDIVSKSNLIVDRHIFPSRHK